MPNKPGRPKGPPTVNWTFRLPADLVEKVKTKVKRNNTTGTAYIKSLIENDINQSGEKK
jgi:predicted DNA-binding protein